MNRRIADFTKKAGIFCDSVFGECVKAFPDDIIITVDDDFYYSSDFIGRLIEAYRGLSQRFNEDIYIHRAQTDVRRRRQAEALQRLAEIGSRYRRKPRFRHDGRRVSLPAKPAS